jgi:hypothetical protein
MVWAARVNVEADHRLVARRSRRTKAIADRAVRAITLKFLALV